MKIDALETPCLIIDVDTMQRNIEKMAEIAQKNNVALRPHTKTHKIPEIARLQLSAGARGITVAKLAEAEVMAEHGCEDIFIAYPIIGESKINRLLALNRKIRLITGVDSITGAKALAEAARAEDRCLEIYLEIDTGLRRTGVPYDQAIRLAKEINALPGVRLTGIYTFRGLLYRGRLTDDRAQAGREEGELMAALAADLRREGLQIANVSVGSTPTSQYAAQVPGITEIRPGTYVFHDAKQVTLGVCSYADCAAKILVTVVSKPTAELAIVDGGSKTFAADAPRETFPTFLKGYGYIEQPGLILERLTEEHGMVRILEGAPKLNIGDRIAVIPNHVCTAINLHNRVFFVRGNIVLKEVAVAARGMVY